MYTSNCKELSSGARLSDLIQNGICEIVKSESVDGSPRMCLYDIGEYWVGFERSAYLMTRIIPNSDSFLVNYPGYPFAVVGISIPAEALRSYLRSRDIRYPSSGHLEILGLPFEPQDYAKWHKRQEAELKID